MASSYAGCRFSHLMKRIIGMLATTPSSRLDTAKVDPFNLQHHNQINETERRRRMMPMPMAHMKDKMIRNSAIFAATKMRYSSYNRRTNCKVVGAKL
jgi:hypothetical protein